MSGVSPRSGVLAPGDSKAEAAALRRLRQDCGLTQAGLAVRLGRSVGWVTNRETDRVRLTPGDIRVVRAAIRGEVRARYEQPAPLWRETTVRWSRDIPRTCPCDWETTFEGTRVSGWALAKAVPSCPHHGRTR